ncbi:MAG: hypothetical protein AAGD22_04925 [Verrucomicrobiota bacterium]
MIKKAEFGAVKAAMLGVAYARSPISLRDLPEAVSRAVRNYFPGARVLSVMVDEEEVNTKYDVKVAYRDLDMELGVTSEGRLLAVDV